MWVFKLSTVHLPLVQLKQRYQKAYNDVCNLYMQHEKPHKDAKSTFMKNALNTKIPATFNFFSLMLERLTAGTQMTDSLCFEEISKKKTLLNED